MTLSTQRKRVALAVVVVVMAGLAGAFIVNAAHREAAVRRPTAATTADTTLAAADVARVPHIVFRSTSLGPTYGKVGLVPLSAGDGPRAITKTDCDRVYAMTTTGICVAAERGVTTT